MNALIIFHYFYRYQSWKVMLNMREFANPQ